MTRPYPSGSPFRAAQSSATDPVAWIMDCHRRIRRVVGGLGALAASDPDDARRAPTAAGCERYLRLALPLHAADEDESLLPALLALQQDPALEQALDRMRAEHSQIVADLPAALRTLAGVALGAGPGSAELGELASWAEGLLIPHIEQEERAILPAASALTPASLEDIALQMRSRRAGSSQS